MNKAKILIVDDEVLIAESLKIILKRLNYSVCAIACTGREAIEEARNCRPDLILMDIVLRGDMDGIEAASEIMKLMDVAIIYVTANADIPTVERAHKTEPYSYLNKPVQERDLSTNIESALYSHGIKRQLKESEERIRSLLEAVPNGIYECDLEGKITQTNTAYETITGYSRDEILNMYIWDFMADEVEKKKLPDYLKYLVSEQPVPEPYGSINRNKNGSLINIVVDWAFKRDSQGKNIGFACVLSDVTEKKRFENAIEYLIEGGASRYGDEFFELMVKQMSRTLGADYTFIGELVGDKQDTVRTISLCVDGKIVDNIEYKLGKTPCENVAGNMVCSYPSDVAKQFPEDILLVEMGVEGYVGVPLFDSHDNPLGIIVALYKKPLEDPNFAETLIQIFAARIASEIERKYAVVELVKSEERYKELIEGTENLVVQIAPDGNFIFVNRTFCSLFCKEPDECKSGSFFKYVHPDESDKTMEMFDKWKSEKALHASYENRLVVKTGKVKDIQWTINFHYNEDGILTGINLIGSDITEAKKAQDLMLQTEKMTTVGSLAAGMAHEINNPIGIILQGSQLITNRLSPENEKNRGIARENEIDIDKMNDFLVSRKIFEYLKNIQDAGKRAAGIVSSMLQFSRKGNLNILPVNINNIIDNTIELALNDQDMNKQYDLKKINIKKNYNDELPTVNCVEIEIEQVILNLLKNAMDAISEVKDKGYKPEIIISTGIDGKDIEIEIYDNGPGIGRDSIKEIFEPFYTTKKAGHGTGLGLFVCNFIISNKQKGSINAESDGEKGVNFIIRLPLDA